VIESPATGGQRKVLPALFALTVAGAGALVLVLTKKDDVSVVAPPEDVVTASANAPADSHAEPPPQDPKTNGQQHRLEIERALVSNSPQQRDAALYGALPELLAADPASVVELVARQEGETRNMLRDEVVRQWIRRDRDAAVIWIGSMQDESERKASATVAMRTLAAIEPAQAVAVADEFGVGRDDGSLEHIVQIWAAENPDECLRWLETQPDNALTAQLRARAEKVRD
jgi:hypothetical protein